MQMFINSCTLCIYICVHITYLYNEIFYTPHLNNEGSTESKDTLPLTPILVDPIDIYWCLLNI
jgi:hypothetical protein